MTGAALTQFAGVGRVLANKYHVERIVGAGGMGLVVAARDVRRQHPVAIKFPLPRISGNEKLVRWFYCEARAAKRICSRHAVRVLDSGVRGDGVPYFVMELLDGETLAHWLGRYGAQGIEDAVDILLEAGTAVATAHALGVVHRDLKPANLFLARGPREHLVKVLDFGIAKSHDVAAEASGLDVDPFIGSLPYMSPEQLVAPASVDCRSDIWMLGAVIYECLAGASPFADGRVDRMCARILQEPTPLLSELRPDVPLGLAQAVSRCLCKVRQRRFASIAELAYALAPYGSARAGRSLAHILSVDAPSLSLGGQSEAESGLNRDADVVPESLLDTSLLAVTRVSCPT